MPSLGDEHGAGPPAASGARCAACGGELRRDPRLSGPDRLHRTPGLFAVAVCGRCGGGLTLPDVPAAELSAYYPDAYAPHEPASGRLTRAISALVQRWQAWAALRSAPLAAIPNATPGRALDVGCGRGDLGAALIARGWSVTGIEPSAAACATARARGLDAREGTLSDVELEPESYDVAILQHSIEHLPDPIADLASTSEALRDGALLLVTVPNFGCWQRRWFGSWWFHLDLPRHRVHFTPSALERALARAGFELDELSLSTSAVGLPASIQYRLFGRCLFPQGLKLRLAAGIAAAAYPVARLLDRLARDGDLLHAVARKRGD